MRVNSLTIDSHQNRRRDAALVLVGAMVIAGSVLHPRDGLVILLLCASAGGLFLLANDIFQGRIDSLLVLWTACFPFYSLVSFPRERSIVTLERAVLGLAFVALFLAKPGRLNRIPQPLRRAGVAGLVFIALAGLTLGKAPDPLNAGRYLVEGFAIPICFAWCVVAWFDVPGRLPALHSAVCVSSVICASVAAAEIATGEDLLPVPGSKLDFAAGIARPNGPFATNDQLALIGAVSLFLLLFLRVGLGQKLSAGRRLIHLVGITAAIGTALMPMFRSVVFTLLLVLVIDTLWERRIGRRVWRIVLIATLFGLVAMVSVIVPTVFEDRSGSGNVYARVAEYEQSLKVFADHPILGVGFSNFNNFVAGESEYVGTFDGVRSVDYPHSNLSSALTETGLLGFVPYAMLHILLALAVWRLCRSSAVGRVAWKYVVYMMLAYWITGLTESSGFEESSNVWYAFAIAVCYKYVLTLSGRTLPVDRNEPTEDLNAAGQVYSPSFH